MPSTRALVGDGVLIGRMHEGFPTSPGYFRLACLQHGGFGVHEPGQMRTVQVSLGRDSTGTRMPALPQRLVLDRPAMAALRELGPPGVQLDHVPASTRSQAGEERDNGPRGTPTDRAPKLFLPGAIGELFQLEGAPQRQHPMGQLAVAALARGRQLAVHFTPPRLDLAPAFGDYPAVAPRLHAPALVIVSWVVGPALPVKLPVQAAQVLPVGGVARSQAVLWHHRRAATDGTAPGRFSQESRRCMACLLHAAIAGLALGCVSA
jgi:hypothetical protein